jgi:uncharacterized SAM-binding protein YcdF (DUF218 family)
MTDRPAAARPRLRSFFRRALLGLAAIAGIWLTGLVWFADTIPDQVADPATVTDAIVVLTGGSQRLNSGLDLLAAGKARKLFVSGVHQGVELAELLRVQHHPEDWITCCIVLGHDADNTRGNALETAAWMEQEKFRSLRLVTAGYHMRRSLLEFRRAMPRIQIIPHPVFPERIKQDYWWAWPGTAALIIGEYHKYLGAVLRDEVLDPANERVGAMRSTAAR